MSTLVTLAISSPEEAGRSWQIELSEDFDTVFNKLFPLQPPTSSLESQANMTHTTVSGSRVAIHPNDVRVVEEVLDDDRP